MDAVHQAGAITGVGLTYAVFHWLKRVICTVIHRSSVIQRLTTLETEVYTHSLHLDALRDMCLLAAFNSNLMFKHNS